MSLKPVVLLLLIFILASVTLAHQVDEEGRPSLIAHKAGAAASYASGAAKSQTQIATDMQRLKAARPSRLGALHRQAKEMNQVAAAAQNKAAVKYEHMADVYGKKADNARTRSVRGMFNTKVDNAMQKRHEHKQQADFHQRVADSEALKEQFITIPNEGDDSAAQYRTAPAQVSGEQLPPPVYVVEPSVNRETSYQRVEPQDEIVPAPMAYRARRYQPMAQNIRRMRPAAEEIVEYVDVPAAEYVDEQGAAPMEEVVYEPPAQFM